MYFIGNWKMYGDFSSIKILKSINLSINKVIKKKDKVVFCVPYTLLSFFSLKFKKSRINIGAQNSHHLPDGPFTGFISSKMIKKTGAKYVILGHSESRASGENNKLINLKIKSAIKNNLAVIYCIGETLKEKRNKDTNKVLSKQIKIGLKNIKNIKNIIVSYEPVWSIGTGVIPKIQNLKKTIAFIKSKFSKKYKNKVKIIYGGSVNPKTISTFRNIKDINGFLIGGASQSKKKFIDIIKNYYK